MDNYYQENKKWIMGEIKLAIPHYRRFVVEAYGILLADAIIAETLERFLAGLSQIPFIGGRDNRLTENLYLSSAMLAFYQALKTQGKTVVEAARIIYLGTAHMYSSLPFLIMLRLRGRRLFNYHSLANLQRDASKSQERKYAGDWVYNLVEGDAQRFIFGVNYTECGIQKYLAEQGASELTAHLCWLDYPMCAAMRVGLIRTQTLAQGGDYCNFRFCRWQDRPDLITDFMKV